jgi:hypothetical protein
MAKLNRLILVKDEDYQKAKSLLFNAEINTGSITNWYFHGMTAVVTFVATGLFFGLLWFVL